MPIYVRVLPGSKRGGDISGPYDETKLSQLREQARGQSGGGKTIDIYWICGRRKPMLCAIYQNGQQKYPRNKQEEKSLANVTSCMARPSAATKSSERTPRQITSAMLSKARKLPNRFSCPARIVATQQLQELSLGEEELAMPQPVDNVGGMRVIEGPFAPPLAPYPGRSLDVPGYLYDPFKMPPKTS